MLKVSFFRGETEAGPTVVPLFNRTTDGALEKTASSLLPEVVRYIDSLRPRPDAVYNLVNAMGAGEYFGSNINGDYFPEAALIHRPDRWDGNPVIDKIRAKDWPYGFPTFYFAHPYAHHRNKDASRAFGEVELAAWNDRMKRVELVTRCDKDKCLQYGGAQVWDKLIAGMFPDVSMGCLPAGGRITMADGSFKRIEQIQEADLVLTHTGQVRRVTQTMRRAYRGKLYSFSVYGFRRPLQLTGEHPVWVVRADQLECVPSPTQTNKGRKQRRCTPMVKDRSKGCTGCAREPSYTFEWVPAEDVDVGDYVAFPVPDHVDPFVSSKEEAKLLGYYLAEGFIRNYGDREEAQVTFCLNYQEKEIAEEIECLARHLGAKVVWHDEQPERGGRYVHVGSSEIARRCAWLCGSGAKEKQISREVLYMAPELQLVFLGAYLDGDGGTYQGSAYFSTASEQLADQLFIVLSRVGVIASINEIQHRPSEKSVVRRDTVEYQVWVGTDFAEKLAPYTRKPVRSSLKIRGQRFFYKHEGVTYLMAPVLEVGEEDFKGDVFNFSVEEDESYVAERLAVHNCKVPFDTCFPAGTLVRTRDGQKPIEQIRVGDFVLSHTGAYREVRQTMRRKAEGLVRITASGLPSIDATDNHPFLVLRREQARTCKGSANGNRLRHSFSDSATCKRCGKAPEFELVWAAAETLKPGDYLATPVPSTRRAEYDVTPAQARLLGYYLGDGYIIRQRTGKRKDGDYRDVGFGFSVGSEETAHLQRLFHTIVEAGAANEPNVYDAGNDRKAHIVSVYDQSLAAWLQKWGGRTSHGKHLNEEVFYWSREAKLELVAGYIDTDGSFDAKGQIRIASVNRGLLLDVQRLLLSEGITATVCSAGTNSSFGVNSELWYLVLSTAQSQKFLGRSTKVTPVDVGWESPQSFFWNGYWLTPVKAVEELDGDVEVFNLSVDRDESYVAEGRAVHNCSICLDWKLYREAQATFDPKKHKHPGEAVLAFHKNKHKIRGLSITRSDYCDHAKKQMNRILPDGRKVFVYNDYPRFFDISFVFIGADKTAKTMMKIASGPSAFWDIGPSAEMAEKLGYSEEPSQVKTASALEDLVFEAAFGKNAKAKKSEIIKDVIPSQFAGKAIPALNAAEQDLPRDLLNLMGRGDLKGALASTGGLGIVLRPREFQRIILVQLGAPDVADELDMLGEVFPKTHERAPLKLDSKDFIPALVRLLLPFLMERSAIAPALERRLLWGITSAPKEKRGCSSLSSDLLRKIGAAYNSYRDQLMELTAHTQDLLKGVSSSSASEFRKLSSASPEEIFSPLSVEYLNRAFIDEQAEPDTKQARAGVERGFPSRNT